VSDTAVLVADMLNAYGDDDADLLATNVAEIISPLSALRLGAVVRLGPARVAGAWA
jgi:hypothetical protein